MRRRDFVTATAIAAAGVLSAPRPGSGQQARDPRLDRMAIMSLSFDRILETPHDPDNPARTLDVMDLPRMYVERYGIHGIEMQHSHFHSTEPEYLREFLNRVQEAKCRITQINAASWGGSLGPFFNLSVPGYTRVHLIDITKRWIDHAVALACPRVMLWQGTLAPEVRPMAVESYRTLVRYGRERGVMVTLESRSVEWIGEPAAVIEEADGYGTIDLGAPNQESQFRMIRAMYPRNAGSIHVKMNPERYSLPAALAMLKELGYTGLFSIEAGSGVDPDPYVAVQKILDVTLANI